MFDCEAQACITTHTGIPTCGHWLAKACDTLNALSQGKVCVAF